MKTSPLPFSPLMARAWYEDRKTQTRRVMLPQPGPHATIVRAGDHYELVDTTYRRVLVCPYGGPGDRVWVRETLVNSAGWARYACDGRLVERDGRPAPWDWKVNTIIPRYMPRWACRSYGDLIDVRLEPVRTISTADKAAEGLTEDQGYAPAAFEDLWNQINAERGYGWDANPWVWVLTLRRLA